MEGDYCEIASKNIEIDIDYELDAVSFFDFTREETLLEAREAEGWFHSAPSYPPSPFAARLVPGLDMLRESHVDTSPKSEKDDMNVSESSPDETEEGASAMEELVRDNGCVDKKPCLDIPDRSMETFHNQMQNIQSGLSFCNPMIKDNFKVKTRSSAKPSFPRISTLMKPTVSQLSKQKKARQMGTSSVMEIQAPKRRKLEGGHLCKVGETTQQSNFVHKGPKKPKMQITVPRGPDLETAQRARWLRPKAGEEPDDMIRTVTTFNACPSNRKILEYPSSLFPKRSTPQVREFQEFHFKTSERAMQHLSATSSTIPPNNSAKVHKFSSNLATECGNREPRRPNPMDNPTQERCESSHIFKALPLNRKILTSKGDIGVFRTTKRETTVPMEFNFHTEKRVHHNLPIDMFNKLSLGSDPQASTGSQLKPSRPKFLLSKRTDNIFKEQEVKEKLLWAGSKHNYCGSINEANPPCGITRNLSIR